MEDTETFDYADEETAYVRGSNIENIIIHGENDALKKAEWSQDNCMKLNEDKNAT